jgi:hypothetical protein
MVECPPLQPGSSLKMSTGHFLYAQPYHPGNLDIYDKNTNPAFTKQTDHRGGWWNVHPFNPALR